MNRRARVCAGAALVLVLAAVPMDRAEAQEAAGSWEATWAQAVRRNTDGTVEIQRWGDARLVLERDGDALSGTWFAEAGGVTWRVGGTIDGSRVRLRATDHDSDDPELAMVESMNWDATLENDRLEGTIWLVLRPGRESIKRPWSAERAPG